MKTRPVGKYVTRLRDLKKEDKQAQQKKGLNGGERGTHEEEKKQFGA